MPSESTPVYVLGSAIYQTAKASVYASSSIGLSSVQVCPSNSSRKGIYLYNNSANSIYVAFGVPANSNTSMTIIIPTFTTWIMPSTPVYTGPMYGIRNAGSGTVLVTELS